MKFGLQYKHITSSELAITKVFHHLVIQQLHAHILSWSVTLKEGPSFGKWRTSMFDLNKTK